MNDSYYMGLAEEAALSANCLGHKVGAVLLLPWVGVRSVSFNGTPGGLLGCEEGGCQRCADRLNYQPGLFYDMCICVHAEQNCLLECARIGRPTDGAILYTTLKPCLGCCKELIQAGIREVVYQEEWELRMPFFEPDHHKMLEHLHARQLQKGTE